jgi:hypothetical protein
VTPRERDTEKVRSKTPRSEGASDRACCYDA